MVAIIVTLPLSNRLAGQAIDRFEVASIRPSTQRPEAGTKVELFPGGRIRIANEPIRLLLRMAFHLQDAQIAGAPGWIATERYDIEAKTGTPEKLTPGMMGPLMQSLLAERFQLKFHRETRELTVGALVVASGGPKLKISTEGGGSGENTSGNSRRSQLVATGTSMELFAAYLGNRLDRIVVDQTGLAARYDFTLEWAPDETADSSAPGLIAALRDQVGLRIEPRKAPVEVLVVDSISKPSAN